MNRKTLQPKISNENRGFNSALYFNQNNYGRKRLEIDPKAELVEKKRIYGSLPTPKSIETPPSCTSLSTLKKCISNDLFNKIQESSPIKSDKSRNTGDDLEIISPDYENFDESSDNIIISLHQDLEEVNEHKDSDDKPMFMNSLNNQNYFLNAASNVKNSVGYNNLNQYSSHPNHIGLPINKILPANTSFFFNNNNSEGNLLKFGMNCLNIRGTNISASKQEENSGRNSSGRTSNSSTETVKSANGKNIIKKTINNQDIKGWVCIQCKNFNYESKNIYLI